MITLHKVMLLDISFLKSAAEKAFGRKSLW